MSSSEAGPQWPRPFGRYDLLASIAVGGMGEVFLARTRGAAGIDKKVVIKKILPHLAREPEFVSRFLDEARLVVTLTHGNIAQVFDMGQVKDEYFIAMEHIDGCDLRELLRRCRAHGRDVPDFLVLFLLSEVCDGLAYAHTQGGDDGEEGEEGRIIHRDVSPSNIMVSRDGAVKLVDFGVAKATSKQSRSVTGAVRGTFQYMSPEQAAGGALDPRSDIFSLGVVTYELLTGLRPFDAGTDLRTLDRIRHETARPIAEVAEGVPEEIASLVTRCLEKDASARPSADELRKEALSILYALRDGEVVTARDLGTFVREILKLEPAEKMSVDEALARQLDHAGSESAGQSQTGDSNGTATIVRNTTDAPLIPVNHTSTGPATVPPGVSSLRGLKALVTVLVVLVAMLIVLNLSFFLGERRSSLTPAPPTPTSSENSAARPSPHRSETPRSTAEITDIPGEEKNRRELTFEAERERRPMETSQQMRVIRVVTDPAGAKITVQGLPAKRAPASFRVPLGTSLRGSARLPDYAPAYFTLHRESPETLRLRLKTTEKGTVKFRFFPANANVRLGGKPLLNLASNVVTQELAPGEYTLEVSTPDGLRKTVRQFRVEEGTVRQLGTIEP